MSVELAENQANAHAAVNRLVLGEAVIALSNQNVILSDTQAQHAYLVLAGTLTEDLAVIVPAEAKEWVVYNVTSGSHTVTVRPDAGTGVTVAQGDHARLRYALHADDVIAVP